YSVRFSMIIVIAGMVLYLSGSAYLREVLFPIAFLVFAIPLPYTLFRSMTFPLQLFSTKATYSILTIFGIPALRQGNIIHLTNYSLEVIEACSGLRSIITLSALAAIFSYFSAGGMSKKVFMLGMSIPVAMAANVIRLLVTVFGALIFGPNFAEGFLHEFSGILVFLVGLAMLFFLGSMMKWIGRKKSIGWSYA
ncbi:MAG: exosortase/archaeosortase family protein, partial [bacterium]